MRILVIPDVHGREFWKHALDHTDEFDKIIFLGDYLDSYGFEFIDDSGKEIDRRRDNIDNFKKILDFKKEFPDKVILLQGNHDCEYSVSTRVCDCRRDKENYNEIEKLFRDNADLFKLCHEEIIDGRRYWFCHSGIRRAWAKYAYNETVSEDEIIGLLNKDFSDMFKDGNEPAYSTFAPLLGMVSMWRGGWDDWSSPVWTDVREFNRELEPFDAYQIFGHTLCEKPLVTDKWAMLDCRECFIFDDGTITNKNNEKIEVISI